MQSPAQPLAALPPYGCGVPLAGATRTALRAAHISALSAARFAGGCAPNCACGRNRSLRSVFSEAHPPGDLLLPLRGNSPCVPGKNEFRLHFAACGRRNSAEGFFLCKRRIAFLLGATVFDNLNAPRLFGAGRRLTFRDVRCCRWPCSPGCRPRPRRRRSSARNSRRSRARPPAGAGPPRRCGGGAWPPCTWHRPPPQSG